MLTYTPSGSPLVVGSDSIDSLAYVLGTGVEHDNMRLFKRLLRRGSVVLDVGANFGVFTVAAAERVLPSGRIYAVEANPTTFGLLRWTLQANGLLHHSRVTATNAAATARSGGAVEIFFRPDELGGATLHGSSFPGLQSASVTALAIDDLIPADVAVDVVKIDVEGHEPHVLAGMARLVERSPEIVIFLEAFEQMTERSYGYRRFMDELWAAGWTVHQVEAGARLSIIPSGVYPGGERYLVLAKRSLLHLMEALYVIHPDELHFGPAPNIFYGPYICVDAGLYRLRLDADIDGEVVVTCTTEFGSVVLGESVLSEASKEFVFRAPEAARTFEVVARALGDARLNLRRIDLLPGP